MKILLSGYNGVMGQVVSSLSDAIVAGYSNEQQAAPYPTYTDLDDVKETYDVILDFSHPAALKDLLNAAVKYNKPIVIASTGLSEGHHQMIDLASSHVAILQSGNFSLGVNALESITEHLTKMLQGYDVEIIEKHHNLKVDAPSGTAQMLAQAVLENSETLDTLNYGRQGAAAKRLPNEIGVHAVRGGSIVGEHTVLFAGTDEVIEIKHTAYSKQIFANGALRGCAYILAQKPGRYTMKDVIQHD